MTPNRDSDTQIFPKWVAVYFIVFFGVIFSVNGAFVYFALKSNTGVVAERSYQQGAHYNDTIEKAEEQDSLGLIQSARFDNGTVYWTLKTKDDMPITHADVTGRAVRPVQGGVDYDISFENAGNGTYISHIEPPLPGEWTIRLKATWDTNTYQALLPIVAQ